MLLIGLYSTLIALICVVAIDHYIHTKKINEAQHYYLATVLQRRNAAYQAVAKFINSYQLQVLANQNKSSVISRPTLTNIHQTLQVALSNSVWLSHELLRNLNDFNLLILAGKANFIAENWKYHSFTDLDINSATLRINEIELQYTEDLKKLNDVKNFLKSKNKTSSDAQKNSLFNNNQIN